MLFVRTAILCALTAVSVMAVDYKTILKDLKIVDADFKNFTSSCNAFGLAARVFLIRNRIPQFNRGMRQVTTDVNATSQLPASGGSDIGQFLRSPFGPDLKAVITCVNVTMSAGLESVARGSRQSIRADIDAMTDALMKKAPHQSLLAAFPSLITTFDSYFGVRCLGNVNEHCNCSCPCDSISWDDEIGLQADSPKYTSEPHKSIVFTAASTAPTVHHGSKPAMWGVYRNTWTHRYHGRAV